MQIDIGAADAGKMLQAKPDTGLARGFVHQQGIGRDLADIGGVGTLDPANIGIGGIVVDIDGGCEIVVNAERAQLTEAFRKQFPLHLPGHQVEFPGARQRLKSPLLLEPPHQPAFLVDEHHWAGRQRGDLRAQAAELFGGIDIVVVFPGPAGIIEQDHAAEPVSRGKLLQPAGNGFSEKPENEEFADGHADVWGLRDKRRLDRATIAYLSQDRTGRRD